MSSLEQKRKRLIRQVEIDEELTHDERSLRIDQIEREYQRECDIREGEFRDSRQSLEDE